MEPVFQRLGDVTIQRLEKPKESKLPSQIDVTPLHRDSDGETSSPEGSNGEKTFSNKRITEVPGPSNKRFKLDLADVTLEKKNSDESNVQNFSDNELSEYYSESDIESEGEDEMPFTSESSKEEKMMEEQPSYLEKFTERAIQNNSASTATSSGASVGGGSSGDTEDYDYDIKQKLKEMGEISFETVKKSDIKTKKVERISENEVVVTPAKKPSE